MFKEQLRIAMTAAGLNQKGLSEATGISRASISDYLSGRSIPRPGAMKKIENILGALSESTQKVVDCANDEDLREQLLHMKTVPVKEAALLLGKSPEHVRMALVQGSAPYGYAVKGKGNSYDYHISPKKLIEYQIM